MSYEAGLTGRSQGDSELLGDHLLQHRERGERSQVHVPHLAVGGYEHRRRRADEVERLSQQLVRVTQVRERQLVLGRERITSSGRGSAMSIPSIANLPPTTASAANFARNGASSRHGPHHCAQTLISSGLPRRSDNLTAGPPVRHSSVTSGSPPSTGPAAGFGATHGCSPRASTVLEVRTVGVPSSAAGVPEPLAPAAGHGHDPCSARALQVAPAAAGLRWRPYASRRPAHRPDHLRQGSVH
jgi:hypothetical protein